MTTSEEHVPERPVLAGYDGTATAHDAALWAAEEAARRGRPLVLVRTYPKDTNIATLDWTPSACRTTTPARHTPGTPWTNSRRRSAGPSQASP